MVSLCALNKFCVIHRMPNASSDRLFHQDGINHAIYCLSLKLTKLYELKNLSMGMEQLDIFIKSMKVWIQIFNRSTQPNRKVNFIFFRWLGNGWWSTRVNMFWKCINVHTVCMEKRPAWQKGKKIENHAAQINRAVCWQKSWTHCHQTESQRTRTHASSGQISSLSSRCVHGPDRF